MRSDYGQKAKSNMNSEPDMYMPGSPDARSSSGQSYGGMGGMSSYGKKVSTTKNKTGTGEPNTGIQGDATSKTGDRSKPAMYGKKKSYRAHYGGAAGKTSKGKDMEHKVKRHRTKEA